MNNLRCVVVDDEPLAQELIKGYVEKTPFLDFVGAFSTASAAVKTILNEGIDLIFLDIQMAELNGIEFARIVPENCRVIFVSAYEKYAVEAFKANALDYLLKPVNYAEFLASANKAMQWFSLCENSQRSGENAERFIVVKSEYKLIQIPQSKILYIEGLKDYVKFVLDDGTTVMSLMSLKNIDEYLPSHAFMRVHRSYIVQTSKINVIERNSIVFGKTYIPISESYKAAFNAYLNSHSFAPLRY